MTTFRTYYSFHLAQHWGLRCPLPGNVVYYALIAVTWGWTRFSETGSHHGLALPFIFREDGALSYRAEIPDGLHQERWVERKNLQRSLLQTLANLHLSFSRPLSLTPSVTLSYCFHFQFSSSPRSCTGNLASKSGFLALYKVLPGLMWAEAKQKISTKLMYHVQRPMLHASYG